MRSPSKLKGDQRVFVKTFQSGIESKESEQERDSVLSRNSIFSSNSSQPKTQDQPASFQDKILDTDAQSTSSDIGNDEHEKDSDISESPGNSDDELSTIHIEDDNPSANNDNIVESQSPTSQKFGTSFISFRKKSPEDSNLEKEESSTGQLANDPPKQSCDIPKFPAPMTVDFSYSSSLPRLNTVANFDDKKLVTCHPQEPEPESDQQSVSEPEIDNIKNVSIENERNLKSKEDPQTYVWSNFKDKKIVSYIPRPTTQDIYLDRRPKGNFLNKKVEIINDHVQLLSKSNGNDLIKEMKRLKREEMKECNSNLGRFYEGIENADGVLLIQFIF